MYHVTSSTGRSQRLHINQLRSRVGSGHAEDVDIGEKAASQRIALDILLDSWGIDTPNETDSPLQPHDSSSSSSLSLLSPTLSPVSSPMPSSAVSSPEQLQSPTSPGFATADSGTPSPVPPPRRSSRARRSPRWMAPYKRY